MMAEVAWFCLNSSAAYLSTAVNGADSGTLSLGEKRREPPRSKRAEALKTRSAGGASALGRADLLRRCSSHWQKDEWRAAAVSGCAAATSAIDTLARYRLGRASHAVGQLRVAGQHNLELDLGRASGRHADRAPRHAEATAKIDAGRKWMLPK